MKTPLKILVLIGFICQGFTWNEYSWPMVALYVIIWGLCMRFPGKGRVMSDVTEIALFGFFMILAIFFAGRNPFTCSLYIGNSLIFLQVVRLLNPTINHRDRILVTAIAITHLAIGSMVVLDYSFILILGAVILLLPKVMYDLELEGFSRENVPYLKTAFGKRIAGIIFVVMILFFIFFPRQSIISTNPVGMMIRYRAMNSEMETSGSTEGGSDEVLFQIQGDDISYLKKFALDQFDGNTWKSSLMSHKAKRRYTRYDMDKDKHRQVTVKNVNVFGKTMIPEQYAAYLRGSRWNVAVPLVTDGYVKHLKGTFFSTSYISEQGNVIAPYGWQTGNNVYEYWIGDSSPERLHKKEQQRYLAYPAQSERLVKLVNDLVSNADKPYNKAKAIESYLNKNIKYQLGLPNLDRDNPVDDFVFNQKEGHCERFASALALMMRMAKVPSRVVVGYYPTEKNELADFYNVRVKDGHAWTEAYIPGKGWTIFDATPYVEEHASSQSSFMLSIFDWIEYFWYTKVVNYSFSEQSRLLKSVVNFIRDIFVLAAQNLIIIGFILIVAFIGYVLIKAIKNKGKAIGGKWTPKAKKQQLKEARHFYGQMQKILARQQLCRDIAQTPMEFLTQLQATGHEAIVDIEFITRTFCRVKYGNQILTDELKKNVQTRLKALKKQQKTKT